MADISGDARGNSLDGTSAADRVWGLGGDDWILGAGGADFLYGGDGDDRLQGGGGNDRLDGGAGTDTADYGDTASRVRIDLAAGLAAFPGQDWAAETLISIENAVGTAFDDVLIGSAGANALYGGAGNDVIEGGGGNDRLYGGAGDDVIFGQGGNDLIDGGDGLDTVDYSDVAGPMRIDLAGRRVSFLGTTWKVETLAGIEGAIGGAGDDEIIGTAGANRLDGGLGDDVIRAGSGADTTVWSEGADAIYGGAGIDTLALALGYDANGGATLDPDEIVYDSLYAFRDDRRGTVPTDFLITVDLSVSTIEFTSDFFSATATLDGVERVQIGADAFAPFSGAYEGGAFSFEVLGTSAGETFRLGAGEHVVNGRAGDDTIYGGRSSVRFFEEGSYPELDHGPEVLMGGAGDDVLHGNGNSDRTHSGGDWDYWEFGEDRLYGGSGADELYAGFKYTLMAGGAGADSFFVDDGVAQGGDNHTYDDEMVAPTIIDFDPEEGDRICVDLGQENAAAGFRYVGLETDNEHTLRISSAYNGEYHIDGVRGFYAPRGEYEARSHMYGYYQYAGDTFIKIQLRGTITGYDDDYHKDIAILITLPDYEGAIEQSDIVFV